MMYFSQHRVDDDDDDDDDEVADADSDATSSQQKSDIPSALNSLQVLSHQHQHFLLNF